MLSRSSLRGLGTPKIKITRSGRVGPSFRFHRQQNGVEENYDAEI